MTKDADTEKSLKSQNFKWHVALASADAIVLVLFVAPELITSATTTQLGLYRAIGAAIIPVLVLLFMNVLPWKVKALLVYWKPLGWLPGCEAFNKYGPGDPRIDLNQLKRNVGAFPTEPNEQNSKWYKLFKMVEKQTEVTVAEKDFLMYRDMAVVSLPLVVLAPFCLYASAASAKAIWGAAVLFAVQYLLTAVSARHAGERLVCNVLAVHAARKMTNPKASAGA